MGAFSYEEVRPGALLYTGDCLDVLKSFPDNHFDSIVEDPPAGISFLGLDWDKNKGGRDNWIAWMQAIALESLRVLKPGGHALVWAIPRTAHWTAMAWENAGWEVRDRVEHIFGTGFSKSHNVSKDIDKAASVNCPQCSGRGSVYIDGMTQEQANAKVFEISEGKRMSLSDEATLFAGMLEFCPTCKGKGRVVGAKRQVVGKKAGRAAKPIRDIRGGKLIGATENTDVSDVTAPATTEAEEWDGWGTHLAPGIEDWYLFRKPLAEKTVAANVLKWGTGALNIKACMVPREPFVVNRLEKWSGFGQEQKPDYEQTVQSDGGWPKNLITDGSPEVEQYFPITSSGNPGKRRSKSQSVAMGEESREIGSPVSAYGDTGSAARFFNVVELDPHPALFYYCAKPSQAEKNFGMTGGKHKPATVTDFRPTMESNPENWANTETPFGRTTPNKNNHPTVKSKELMSFLIRLVTKKGGRVLDCFCGSGSTGKAAVSLGMLFTGIDLDPHYIDISRARIKAEQAPLF